METLSKETRKLRKKKVLSEDESDFQAPIKLKKDLSKRRITRSSSTSTSAVTSTTSWTSIKATYAAVLSKDLERSKGKGKQVDYGFSLAPPSTPVPGMISHNSSSEDLAPHLKSKYDSVDEYDTDDLLDQLDKLTPLCSASSPTTSNHFADTPVQPPTPPPAADEGTVTTARRRRRRKSKNTHINKSSTPPAEDTKQKTTQRRRRTRSLGKQPFQQGYDRQRAQELSNKYPDTYWKYHAESGHMISSINEADQLRTINSMGDQGPVLGMALSQDGLMLATFCTLGSVSIWDIQNNFSLLCKLRDKNEKNVDEFFCGIFQDRFVLAGGKLKDRNRWSNEDEDCHILPCPVKIFDLEVGSVVSYLEGHSEEILCVKSLQFDGHNYYISTSQDGYIMKWHVESDWKTLIDSTRMEDGITCMAFTVSFVPNTGNKYFLAACDANLRLYDFEHAQLLQTFEGIYSSYCDCGKFVNWLDADYFIEQEKSDCKKEINVDLDDESSIVDIEEDGNTFAWFVSRGAEMLDAGEVSSIPNTCTLHRLNYPKKTGEPFELEEIQRYKHDDYHSNSWLVKIASNGRYLFAPTMDGQVFVFNMLTGQLTAIMKEHEDLEVRDVILHPYFPLMFSCGDDGTAKVYTYKETDDTDIMEV